MKYIVVAVTIISWWVGLVYLVSAGFFTGEKETDKLLKVSAISFLILGVSLIFLISLIPS